MTQDALQAALEYNRTHRDELLEHYPELLKFPSISADPAYREDIKQCAEWIVEELKRIGFDNCQTIATAGHPVVYAEWLKAGDDKPTVLVYDHYDVQPIDPLHLWKSEPFTAEIRDGRMYARGVSDNKAGVWGNLKVFESMLQANGKLPLNVKIIFEGEEESGSPSMEPFVASHTDLLKADVMLNCDGGFKPDNPRLSYAGRGIVSAEVKVTGPSADLHSGQYGGVVQNPLHVAGKIIGSFHDEAGRVTLPNYYDNVKNVDEVERQRIHEGWDEEHMKSTSGLETFWGTTIAPDAIRATVLPTLDINGMWGGYQGAGNKTIIPAEANFKVTMRLVPNQNPHEIAKIFKKYVEGFASNTVKVEVTIGEEAWDFQLVTEGAYLEAVQSAIEATIDKRAQLVRTGGSIPILGMFNRIIGGPITGFGYGDGENIHSPNENIKLDSFYLSMQAGIRLYFNLAEAGK